MEIIFKVGDSENVLCHGGVRGQNKRVGPDRLSIVQTRIIDRRTYLEGEHQKPTGRGNKLWMVTFSVSWLCQSLAHAELHAQDYADTLPTTAGELITRVPEDDGGGAYLGQRKYHDAVIDQVAITHMGKTLNVNFTILTGRREEFS